MFGVQGGMTEDSPNNTKLKEPYWINPEYGPQLGKKTHGRIFVRNESDRLQVLALIKLIDESEYESYMPEDYVAVMPDDPVDARLTYGHKFEIRTDLLELECWKAGIEIWIITNYRDPYG